MQSVSQLTDVLRGQLLFQEPLAKYTSWRVGGPADYVFLPAVLFLEILQVIMQPAL